MSDIRFAKSRAYERFFITFHIAAAVICVVLLVLTFCMEQGLKFIPIIFMVSALVSFINAYDKVNSIKKTNAQIRKCIHLVGVGVIAVLVAIFTLIGYLT